MIRDPGALHNLGHGVTSRDVPVNEDETEGVAPNSGYISRAFNRHPVMRFLATTATTMLVAGIASRVTKQGGLKLTKFFEENAKEGGVASRAIYTAKQIRQQLDELQGVNRYVEGEEDVYRKLVFGDGDKMPLTSGYDGVHSERFGYSFLTNEERKMAGSGLLGEPPAVWQFRDELQQRLVRAGRRLPYELPAFYVAQKAFTDPLFGEREQGKSKVKWYNPVDVVADFTKESVKNIATMILPFEAAGAGISSAKSGLHSLQYSMTDIRNLGPIQQKMHKSFVNVTEVLSQVGQDFAGVTNKALRKSAQTSGAFNAASLEFQSQQQGLVQTWHRLRKGVKAAGDQARAQNAAYSKVKSTEFFSLFKPPAGDEYSSVFDLVPAFKGMRAAASAGRKEYKLLGQAQGAMNNAIAFNKVIADSNGLLTEDALMGAIKRIQSQHSSRLSRLASGVRILGGGGPDNAALSSSQFGQGFQSDAFKDLLESQLIHKGIDPSDAQRFIQHLNVSIPKKDISLDKLVTIGKTKILQEGADASTGQDMFFGEILKRYQGIKGSKGLVDNLTPDAFKDAVANARATFVNKDFQKGLNSAMSSSWNKFYRDDLHNVASTILKPKKAIYQDFIGEPTAAKLEFLQRKTAETLGIKLVGSDGQRLANDIVSGELRKRAIDPNDFTNLRSFLIKNKQMTSGVFRGGANLFGMQQLTIDEAQDRGMFKHLRDPDQNIIRNIASRAAINDPVSTSIGLSRLDGVYKTKSGEILDFTSIKSTFSRAANFFASEFKIPLLGFNPADLFGYNSYAEMARRSPIQYVSSRSVQPFIKGQESRADFFIWHKTKGVKGKLTAYSHDSVTGEINTETLRGAYKAVPTNSTDLISRHTRYGSAGEGMTPDEIRGKTGSKLLNKLLGDDAALRFKRKMAIDVEQPNSIWQQLSRFRQRGYDLDNPSTMARLLRGDTVTEKVGQATHNYRLDIIDDALRVVDDAGKIVPKFSEADVLRGYHSLAKQGFQYGMPVKVMEHLEKTSPSLFTALGGRGVSKMFGESELVGFAEDLIGAQPALVRQLRSMGMDPSEILASSSRIKGLLNQSNLNSASMLSQKSPTISTRLDELKNEIFRYISQTNQITSGKRSDEIFTEIQAAVDHLAKTGVISSSQKVEAQAAGLSTMFNINAFKTFKRADTDMESARKAAVSFFQTSTSATSGGLRSSNSNVAELFNPFAEGEIAQVSSSIRKKFSPLLSRGKKKFGTAGYSPDDLSIDPLGSGQSLTMVPTFGTVFGQNPMGAIKSALGFTTYSDPSSFSTGSIPISQGVERLNRYFGTLGMQLDVSSFKGPLDMFARGMVGKRVLPLYAVGTTALTVDRTIGGMVNEKDSRGERVYSPFFLGHAAKGAVELHAGAAGLIPGGMGYEEKKEQLVEGEVPIRQGRFWPLGNTPFKGGKIMYYRPSWYRRLQGGAMFTSDTYGSPAEKFLFYNDISPLRALDPYRFERKHYLDRPYPVTGEYFTGPFGPLTSLGNLTLGKVLKPQKMMHEEELSQGLANYAPAGQFGAYDASAYAPPSAFVTSGGAGFSGGAPGSFGIPGAGPVGGSMQASQNARFAARAGSTNMAGGMVTSSLGQVNAQYAALSYGPPKVSKVMNPRIIAAGSPISSGGMEFQSGELGYRTQEMLGIYGFAFGSLRQGLGFGQSDFEPQRSVLQSASKAYGTSRAFWDLNLGGLGDVPLPAAEGIGNIEFSEIVRRFIPKERTGVDYINPIKNLMGQQYPWLPGAEYYTNFQTGDPFTKVQEGELRLPGVGYERFNRLHPDETGNYGLIDQLNILGDVAPYSQQFKSINSKLNKMSLSPTERIEVAKIRQQVEDVTQKYDFNEYKYKGQTAEQMAMHPLRFSAGRIGEYIAHSDNFIAQKAFGQKTALEDWERRNVYGTTFPQWQSPVESYINPMIYKATQRNPIVAAATLGTAGALFGRSPRARLFGSVLGSVTGFTASMLGNTHELISGDRFIPKERKKELALEEYSDILTYVKNTRLANMAESSGDYKSAAQYTSAAKRTMYGADIYGANIDTLSLAVPKRKREHFKAMLNAPEEDRGKILSTAGRLERRIYEAAWGMDVEKLPDLNEYFTRHELPDEGWEGWHPNTNMDHVKIKTGQSLGLDMSQMGYYPQQIKEANLANPSYPMFSAKNDRNDIQYRLKSLMSGMGVTGTVTPVMTPFGNNQIDIFAGMR